MKYIDYIFDGAFGTYYQQKNTDNTPCEWANIQFPQRVIDIHKDYIKTGVTALKTNTFGVNSTLTENPNQIRELILKGVEHGKTAIGTAPIPLFADIGPIYQEESEDEYLELVKVFIEAGITHFLFETLGEIENPQKAIEYIRKHVPDSVIITSFACNQDGYTNLGNYYKELLDTASELADYVGLNCVCGPLHMYNLILELDYEAYKLIVMPNAGYGNITNQRTQYTENAEYFSDMMVKMAELKVSIMGGCCGTTPLHMEKTIEKLNRGTLVYREKSDIHGLKEEEVLSFDVDEIIKNRKWIAVELEPPVDLNYDYMLEFARRYKAEGADALTFVDSPRAKTRGDSLMMAAKVKREVGIEVLPHLTCRDKNQIAIKGGLISGNIEGVNHVLAVSGDPIPQLDRSESKGVFSFNAMNLIHFITHLNITIFEENPYYVMGALNVNATNFKNELKRAEKKEAQGVRGFITQSIFDEKAIENIKLAKETLHTPIITGLYPVVSYRNAVFLNNEVSGITIPETFIEALNQGGSENYKQITTDYMKSLIDQVYDYCDGFYISTPLKKIDFVSAVIKYIKSLEK